MSERVGGAPFPSRGLGVPLESREEDHLARVRHRSRASPRRENSRALRATRTRGKPKYCRSGPSGPAVRRSPPLRCRTDRCREVPGGRGLNGDPVAAARGRGVVADDVGHDLECLGRRPVRSPPLPDPLVLPEIVLWRRRAPRGPVEHRQAPTAPRGVVADDTLFVIEGRPCPETKDRQTRRCPLPASRSCSERRFRSRWRWSRRC